MFIKRGTISKIFITSPKTLVSGEIGKETRSKGYAMSTEDNVGEKRKRNLFEDSESESDDDDDGDKGKGAASRKVYDVELPPTKRLKGSSEEEEEEVDGVVVGSEDSGSSSSTEEILGDEGDAEVRLDSNQRRKDKRKLKKLNRMFSRVEENDGFVVEDGDMTMDDVRNAVHDDDLEAPSLSEDEDDGVDAKWLDTDFEARENAEDEEDQRLLREMQREWEADGASEDSGVSSARDRSSSSSTSSSSSDSLDGSGDDDVAYVGTDRRVPVKVLEKITVQDNDAILVFRDPDPEAGLTWDRRHAPVKAIKQLMGAHTLEAAYKARGGFATQDTPPLALKALVFLACHRARALAEDLIKCPVDHQSEKVYELDMSLDHTLDLSLKPLYYVWHRAAREIMDNVRSHGYDGETFDALRAVDTYYDLLWKKDGGYHVGKYADDTVSYSELWSRRIVQVEKLNKDDRWRVKVTEQGSLDEGTKPLFKSKTYRSEKEVNSVVAALQLVHWPFVVMERVMNVFFRFLIKNEYIQTDASIDKVPHVPKSNRVDLSTYMWSKKRLGVRGLKLMIDFYTAVGDLLPTLWETWCGSRARVMAQLKIKNICK